MPWVVGTEEGAWPSGQVAAGASEVGTWLAGFGVGETQVKQLLDAVDFGQVASWFASLLGERLGVVSNLVFILTLVLFLTMDAKLAQLKQLAQLKDQGVLTDAEFEAQKSRILG